MTPPAVAGLLLAAGGSRRLGEPKQLLTDAWGVPAVVRMARALREAGCAPVIVVVGAYADAVTASLSAEDVQIVAHPQWQQGMGSSIAAGVRQLQALTTTAETPGVLIVPCDMPTVTADFLRTLRARFSGWERVAAEYTRGDGASVATQRVRGIPAILPRKDWPWLAALAGEQGAKPLLHEDAVAIPLRDGAFDLDTPGAVAQWRVTQELGDSPPHSADQRSG